MDLEGIVLSEINQVEKGKYYMVLLICEIQKQNKIKKKKILNKNKHINTENRLVMNREEEGWGGQK